MRRSRQVLNSSLYLRLNHLSVQYNVLRVVGCTSGTFNVRDCCKVPLGSALGSERIVHRSAHQQRILLEPLACWLASPFLLYGDL